MVDIVRGFVKVVSFHFEELVIGQKGVKKEDVRGHSMVRQKHRNT